MEQKGNPAWERRGGGRTHKLIELSVYSGGGCGDFNLAVKATEAERGTPTEIGPRGFSTKPRSCMVARMTGGKNMQ